MSGTSIIYVYYVFSFLAVSAGRNAFSFNNSPIWNSTNTSYAVGSEGLQRAIDPKTISETIDGFNVAASKANPIYKAKVDEYLAEFNSADFKLTPKLGGGGFVYNDVVTMTEGHHRLVAAAIKGMQTGDYTIFEYIINNSRLTFANPASYNITSSTFPTTWTLFK
ncbi:hypothetical protein [Pedobacter jeongneungensis]